MQFRVIQRILGLLLAIFSMSLLPPLMLSAFNQDGMSKAFGAALLAILTTGLMLWWPTRKASASLRRRDGFLVAVIFWAGLGLSGAVPLVLFAPLNLSWTDAVFESVSGLTTTGATVLSGIDELPISVRFYRQQLQWMGGMGIIVLAVAILPILGIGGMQLYRAETPGPIKDAKITPRVTETAKMLWYLYLGMTVACALGYYFAGMSVFDAICHSFTTLALGGASTHDASFEHFDGVGVRWVAIIFMFLAGVNFSLHFLAWRKISLRHYAEDSECRTYVRIVLAMCAITVSVHILGSPNALSELALTDILFETVSIVTTTGYVSTGYSTWIGILPELLLLSCFVGACAGSTGGGLKVIRVLLLYKQGVREIKRLVHPNGVFLIKLDRKPVPEQVVEAVWGYLAIYAAVFISLVMLMLSLGLDQVTAFTSVAACLNNLGPGLGEVAQNYSALIPEAKWILCLAMLLGRLEILTLLVLMSPIFWRP
ncbi:MAG: potassium transporter TrkG [Candidatus Eutrophobiaceae bacterium]